MELDTLTIKSVLRESVWTAYIWFRTNVGLNLLSNQLENKQGITNQQNKRYETFARNTFERVQDCKPIKNI